jgi:hypothetical protein
LTTFSAKCRLDPWIAFARLQGGDRSAAADWALAVRDHAAEIGKDGWFEVAVTPMWAFPKEPAFRDLAQWLFADSSSPQYLPTSIRREARDVNSVLLTLAAYRDSVLVALAEKDVVGTMNLGPRGPVTVRVGNTSLGYTDSKPGEPLQEHPLRMSDLVAFQLSRIKGFPTFDFNATESERDRAGSETAEFLKIHGADLAVDAPDLAAILDSPAPIFEVKTQVHLKQ